MAVIAVVFDFDDTLLPDSTTALLESVGIDSQEFWTKSAPALVREGYDPPLAYLRLMLDRIGPDQPLGLLSNADLRKFGSSLDEAFFPGLPRLFTDLKREVAKFRDITDGIVRYVKRCVTFTEKTRYLFEINKGVDPKKSRNQPHLVNNKVNERRVPFNQMVYVGDGLTDVPCFSLVRAGGGKTFGVFSKEKKSAKQAFQELLDTKRVDSLHSPDYRPSADLGALIRAAVTTVAANIDLGREQT